MPLTYVSGGALVAGGDTFDRLRLATFTEALLRVGVAALAPTRLELRLGAGEASGTGSPGVPMVAIDVDDASVGQRDLRRMLRFEYGDTFFYVTGVAGASGDDASVGGLKFVEAGPALRELRGELPVYGPLIVLANVTDREVTELARYAGRPTLFLHPAGWSDPGPEDVEEGAVAFAPYPATGKYVGLAKLYGRGADARWTVEYRPIVADLPEDGTVLALRKSDQEVLRAADVIAASSANPRFTPAALSREPPTALSAGATGRYVGSTTCMACHPSAYRAWAQSRHAHALETLIASGDDADPSCVGCHVVGYGTGRGFAGRARTPLLADVGCEQCHGPRGDHVDYRARPEHAPDDTEPVHVPGRLACGACHDGKHDPGFEFVARWPQIEHGR